MSVFSVVTGQFLCHLGTSAQGLDRPNDVAECQGGFVVASCFSHNVVWLPSVEEVLGASGRPTHRDGPAQPGQPQAHGGIATRPQTQTEGTGGAMAAQAGATLPPVPMAPVPTLGRLGDQLLVSPWHVRPEWWVRPLLPLPTWSLQQHQPADVVCSVPRWYVWHCCRRVQR